MSKDSFYFPHDHHSRTDSKIIQMRMEENGWEAYGIYWAIIEKLHEEGGYIPKDYKTLAFELNVSYERITTILESYNLFIIDENGITCQRVLDNIKQRTEKSKKAQASIYNRWHKDTNVIRPKYECNTIKERKGKEIHSGLPATKHVFKAPTLADVQQYCLERGNSIDAEAFITYYQARGWQFGTGKPVKDWKACVRTWELRNTKNPTAVSKMPPKFGE